MRCSLKVTLKLYLFHFSLLWILLYGGLTLDLREQTLNNRALVLVIIPGQPKITFDIAGSQYNYQQSPVVLYL
jgi:hypothetical protein